MDIVTLPSLLAADPGCLAGACRRVADSGADALHLDIMDAHFVPNLSFGPDVAAMAHRTVPALPLHVHLMMTHPHLLMDRFLDAGASSLLIHVEATCDLAGTLAAIRARGVRAGLTLKPATPAEAVFPWLSAVDEVLVMTVEPGYGGQAFLPEMGPKLAAIRREADRQGRTSLAILVDGGIHAGTAAECAAHGANGFISGSALFRQADMRAGVAEMRAAAAAAYGRRVRAQQV
jgi:ribulose-phosphate 3-epimerase